MSTNYLYRNIVSNNVVVVPRGSGVPVVPQFEPVIPELDYTNSPSYLYADELYVYVASRNNNNTQVFDKFTGQLVNTWSTSGIFKLWTMNSFVYYVNGTSSVIKLNRDTGSVVNSFDLSSTGIDTIRGGDLWNNTTLALPNYDFAGIDKAVIAYFDTTNDSFTFDILSDPAFVNNVTQIATKEGAATYQYLLSGRGGTPNGYSGYQLPTSSQTVVGFYNEAPLIVRDNDVVYLARGTTTSTTLAINLQTGVGTGFGEDSTFSIGYTQDHVYTITNDDLFKKYLKSDYSEVDSITANNPSLMTSDVNSNAIWWQDVTDGKIYSIQEV